MGIINHFRTSRAKIKAMVILLLVSAPAMVFTSMKTIAVTDIKEAITPVTQRYIERSLSIAQKNGCDAIIFRLDTPGGELETTRKIVQSLLNSKIDTIVFVAPRGARAGSAGVFITLSAKYAVMAPGCNIGAAHPVNGPGLGGSQAEDQNTKTENTKIENDSAAFISSIAKDRGRNTEWAVKAVRESVSITSEDALSNGVINFIASDIDSAASKIYGDKFHYKFENIPKNWEESFLSVLADPNLVYFLLILGFYGLIYEFMNPGAVFPGTAGSILLITALFSMQVLPFSFTGFLLILLAFIFFGMELFVASYGVLTISGLISLIIGSALLFDSPLTFLRVSIISISAITLITVLFIGTLIYLVSKTLFRKSYSGETKLLSLTGYAINDFIDGKGLVMVNGEIWKSNSKNDIHKGDNVSVKKIDRFTLEVIEQTEHKS